MSVNLTTTETSTSIPSALRRRLKALLWVAMGGMTISVVLYSEVPLLSQVKERAYLGTIPFLIIPHVLAGITALLIGPLQFSSRIRRGSPRFHRALGRVYVGSVFIAAPLAVILSNHRHDPRAIHFVVANILQAGTWITATGAAFLAARNRNFRQHFEWMVRSYAVTFTFVGTRVLQPLPAWNRHSEAGFAIEIIIITFMAILIPDLAFLWSPTTQRRS
jgi:uncharacterized membrane protein